MQAFQRVDLASELGGDHWGLLPAWLGAFWLGALGGRLSGPEGYMLLLSGLMASYDVSCRRIPNAITALGAAAGLAWGLAQNGWGGLGWSTLAGLTGFGLMAVFFFMGAVGAGDVKGLAALSSFLVPAGALKLFVLTTLAGGLLAVAALIHAGRAGLILRSGFNPRLLGSGLKLPYGLAIWAGTVALVFLGP